MRFLKGLEGLSWDKVRERSACLLTDWESYRRIKLRSNLKETVSSCLILMLLQHNDWIQVDEPIIGMLALTRLFIGSSLLGSNSSLPFSHMLPPNL